MMADNLTNDQRKWILKKQYWKTENAEKVRQKWAEESDTPPTSRQTIYRIRDKFDETRSICNAPKSGRPVIVNTQENEVLVSQTFTKSPQKTKQRVSIELGISRRSLSRLMKRLGLKIYRPRLLHGFLEDPVRRLQFCKVVLNDERHGNGTVDKITWSDEAHFKLSGGVNRHNSVYYSTKTPHVTLEGQLNQPGITIWAGLSFKRVLGHFFFPSYSCCTRPVS
jgi:transposase